MDEVKVNEENKALASGFVSERNKSKRSEACVYLVGGYIRDKILNKTTPDKDLVVVGESAGDYAKRLGGRVVLLNAENQIYRVVMEDGTYFDVTSISVPNGTSCLLAEAALKKDALRRDFTINSIYQNLKTGEFFDPHNGREAISKRRIETARLENLIDDPLRMLRAFRFAAVLGFTIGKEILNFTRQNAKLIQKVAKERINYELIKMFEGDWVVENLYVMHKTGLLAEIFPFVNEIEKIPSNTHHHLPLLEHSIETVRNLDSCDPLLKIAAFIHDIGKPSCWTIERDTGRHRFIGHDIKGEKLAVAELKRLKFSRKQIDFISKMVLHHIHPSSLMQQEDRTDKALIRFIRKLDPYVEEVIALARADRLSAQGPAITPEKTAQNLKNLDELLEFYRRIKPRLVELPKLLDGREVAKLLNIKPGKALGEAVDALREAQLEGVVKTKEEAAEFLAQQYARTPEKSRPD